MQSGSVPWYSRDPGVSCASCHSLFSMAMLPEGRPVVPGPLAACTGSMDLDRLCSLWPLARAVVVQSRLLLRGVQPLSELLQPIRSMIHELKSLQERAIIVYHVSEAPVLTPMDGAIMGIEAAIHGRVHGAGSGHSTR